MAEVEMTNRAGWTRDELRAAVAAYIKMRTLQNQQVSFVKKQIYEELAARFDRTPKAFEFRMQNISYVYYKLGRQWLEGLKPAANVGSNMLPVIEELIFELEGNPAPPTVEFEETVRKLRNAEPTSPPPSVGAPSKSVRQTTVFARDARVTAWVLRNSAGRCESCGQPAPFHNAAGEFFLEVHHLRRLADGGTDSISNAIAVCPNCHRELHFGIQRATKLEALYQSIERLTKE